MAVISICPYKNVINLFIKENDSKLLTNSGIHVVADTNANVRIPDIIGDSVKLETNIPKDI